MSFLIANRGFQEPSVCCTYLCSLHEMKIGVVRSPCGLWFPAHALNDGSNKEMYLMCCSNVSPGAVSPVFGGECFSNHFKCSLVLNTSIFWNWPNWQSVWLVPTGWNHLHVSPFSNSVVIFLPFRYSLFATMGDIVFPFSLMLRDDF